MRLSIIFAAGLMVVATQALAQAARPKQPNNWLLKGPEGAGQILLTEPTHLPKENGWLWKNMYWIDAKGKKHLLLRNKAINGGYDNTSASRRYYLYSLVGEAANDRAQCGFVDLSNGCLGDHMDGTCEGSWDEHNDIRVQFDGSTSPPAINEDDYANSLLNNQLVEDRYNSGIKTDDQTYFNDPFSNIENMLRCNPITEDNRDAYQGILKVFKKKAPKAGAYLQKAINDYTKKNPPIATSP
ncbi:hypothetical protein [Dyella japonica]|uniref:Uncharacterized protein n=1 Tax=Dyella japonica TaxID=231455 RepID=A0ABV2K1B2_9GAMM